MIKLEVVICKDCGHIAKDQARHKEHVKEARHIHAFRHLAYRYINDLSFKKKILMEAYALMCGTCKSKINDINGSKACIIMNF